MTPEQEIIFLKTHIAMLQESANSAEMALKACEAQLERYKSQHIGTCDFCGARHVPVVNTVYNGENANHCVQCP